MLLPLGMYVESPLRSAYACYTRVSYLYIKSICCLSQERLRWLIIKWFETNVKNLEKTVTFALFLLCFCRQLVKTITRGSQGFKQCFLGPIKILSGIYILKKGWFSFPIWSAGSGILHSWNLGSTVSMTKLQYPKGVRYSNHLFVFNNTTILCCGPVPKEKTCFHWPLYLEINWNSEVFHVVNENKFHLKSKSWLIPDEQKRFDLDRITQHFTEQGEDCLPQRCVHFWEYREMDPNYSVYCRPVIKASSMSEHKMSPCMTWT